MNNENETDIRMSIDYMKEFIKEETQKEIMNNLDSSLIFIYIQKLEKQNEEMKKILKEKYGYLY